MRTPSIPAAAALLTCLVALAACGTTAPATPSPAPTSSLVAPLGGQTETEWGVIWDTLPAAFPVFVDAVRSDEAADGPASATLVSEHADPSTVAGWYVVNLAAAGHGIESGTSPLEDGSYVLESSEPGDCRVQVTVQPLGEMTAIRVMYGAGCPNP